jgi:hypothetical protein
MDSVLFNQDTKTSLLKPHSLKASFPTPLPFHNLKLNHAAHLTKVANKLKLELPRDTSLLMEISVLLNGLTHASST